MTRLPVAALACLVLLLTACSQRHPAGAVAHDPVSSPPSSAVGQTTAVPPAGSAAPITAAPAEAGSGASSGAAAPTTPTGAAPSSAPTDLGSVRSDLSRAGGAADAADQHLSSAAAAASQPDAP